MQALDVPPPTTTPPPPATETETRTCRLCLQELPLAAFSASGRPCRPCRKVQRAGGWEAQHTTRACVVCGQPLPLSRSGLKYSTCSRACLLIRVGVAPDFDAESEIQVKAFLDRTFARLVAGELR